MKLSLPLFSAAALAFMPTALATVTTGIIKDHSRCWQVDDRTPTIDDMNSWIVEATCDYTNPNQIFSYDDVTSYLTLASNTGRCVDGNQSTGHLKMWTCADSPLHKWRFEGGKMKVQNHCEEVANGGGHAGNWIKAGSCGGLESYEMFPLPSSAPSSSPVSPVLAGANGDPHFATWGGDKYDFHGGCDLVLLKNPNFAKGLGLDIHIRTKIHTWWSFIEMAVVRIGSDVLEVKGGDTNGGSYWINGQLGQDLNDGTLLSLSGFPVKFRLTSAKQNKFRVDLGNGDALSIETYKNFVRVNVKANPNHDQFQGSSGLMGSFPHGVKLARDQTTALEDVNFFGKEWQVLMTETVLFHSSEGVVQHPQECAMPNETEKANKRRRLGESLLTQQDAETACSHVHDAERDACVFDVLATNDKDMAGSY